MSIKDIQFKDESIGNVTVKIDNAYDDTIEIKEIDRINTHIYIDELHDTALFSDIILEATLHEQDDSIITEGVVSINVLSKDKTNVLISQQVSLIDGYIYATINNTLNTGTYYVEISYGGTKYYNPSVVGKFININKRTVMCEFSDFEYYVDAGSTVTLTGIVKDLETKNPISNYAINYKFNDEINQVTTDNIGTADFTLDIPEHNASNCTGAGYKKYELLIGAEDASYILPNKSIILIVKKESTSIDIQGKDLMITGTVLSENGYVNYGTVDISMYEGRYLAKDIVVENGYFAHEVTIKDINAALSSNVTDNVKEISSNLTTKILIDVPETTVNVGDSFIVTARVEDEYQNAVIYGTVDFRLFNSKDKQIYRYITELDEGGMGEFIFYTSKADTYHVDVYYKTVVGYKSSHNTQDIIIEVNNGS